MDAAAVSRDLVVNRGLKIPGFEMTKKIDYKYEFAFSSDDGVPVSLSVHPNNDWVVAHDGWYMYVVSISKRCVIHSVCISPDFAISVHYSPDGQYLVMGSDRGHVAVFSVNSENGELSRLGLNICRPWKHPCRVRVSPCSKYIAVFDIAVAVWDFETRKCLAESTFHKKAITAVEWSADSKYVYSGDSTELRSWDWASDTVTVVFSCDADICTLARKFDMIACAAKNGGVHILYTTSWSEIGCWTVSENAEDTTSPRNKHPMPIAWSLCGKFLACSNTDGLVIYDRSKNVPAVQNCDGVACRGDMYSLSWTDTCMLVSSNRYNSASFGTLVLTDDVRKTPQNAIESVFSLSDLPRVDCYKCPEKIKFAAFHPSGQVLAIALMDGRVVLYSLVTNKVSDTLDVPAGVHRSSNHFCFGCCNLEFSPNGKYLCLATTDYVVLWWIKDIVSFDCYISKFIFDEFNRTCTAAFSPDSKYIAVSTENREIRFYDVVTKTCLKKIAVEEEVSRGTALSLDCLAWDQNSTTVYFVDNLNDVYKCDLLTSSDRLKTSYDNYVFSFLDLDSYIVFIRCYGNWFAYCTGDCQVHIWNIQDKKREYSWKHDDPIRPTSFSWSECGNYLTLGSSDGIVCIFQKRPAWQLLTIARTGRVGYLSDVVSVDWLANGTVAIGHIDGFVDVFQTRGENSLLVRKTTEGEITLRDTHVVEPHHIGDVDDLCGADAKQMSFADRFMFVASIFDFYYPTFSPNGAYYAASINDSVFLWDVCSYTRHQLGGKHTSHMVLKFSPCSKYLAVLSSSQSAVEIWDVNSHAPMSCLRFSFPAPFLIEWATSSEKIFYVGGNASYIYVWNWKSSAQSEILCQVSSNVTAFKISKNGYLAILVSNKISVWDIESGQQAWELPLEPCETFVRMAWSPNSEYLAVYRNPHLTVYDSSAGTLVCQALAKTVTNVWVIEWTPDSKSIMRHVMGQKPVVDVWDVAVCAAAGEVCSGECSSESGDWDGMLDLEEIQQDWKNLMEYCEKLESKNNQEGSDTQ